MSISIMNVYWAYLNDHWFTMGCKDTKTFGAFQAIKSNRWSYLGWDWLKEYLI
jgi:hypothetical protein